MRTSLPALGLAMSLLAASATSSVSAAESVVADLRQGGTATGDMSTSGRETDTITVSLRQGMAVTFKWSATFNAVFSFFGPDGLPADIGTDGHATGFLKEWPVPATGEYRFEISSDDDTQGTYSLSVLPLWPRIFTFEGTGETTFDLSMPALSIMKGQAKALPGAADPIILSILSPEGDELLVRPISGKPIVKTVPIQCRDAGLYRITCAARQGTGGFRAAFARFTRKLPRERLFLQNGVDPPSYERDGIDSYFSRRCSDCHGWASSYEGVRANAKGALARMRSGSMPKRGPRATGKEIALVAKWIATGRAE